jgi:hypothetical protein
MYLLGATYLPCQNYKASTVHNDFSAGIYQFVGLPPTDIRVCPYFQGQSFSPE